ncbi:protein C1orf43 homolog isoform X2 [Aplysia californica]|nr:protein C1orf43 homolog isoform X2 [Aplysia californica]XP_005103741.1 protein C1orf43 homolog isoform X2 [Aplysia californica]
MSTDLSLVSVVLFIAIGALLFCILFLFAKRQIVRFALKSARKPHVNIGSDVPKFLREKIHHCLEKTKSIYFEPTLLSEEVQNAACSTENHYYYRMKALDAFSNAVTTLQWGDSSVPRREAKQTIQLYLYCLCPSAAGSKDAVFIEKFARLYKHARHSPVIFGEKEFIRYMELLDKIIRLIKLDQKRRSKTLKAVDLEVQMKGSKGTETVVHEQKGEAIPLEDLHQRGRAGVNHAEPLTNRDISSGYSSTDRSSSDRGSAERLISQEERRV